MFFLALTLVLFVDAVQYDENNKEESFDSRHEGFDFLINVYLLNSIQIFYSTK